MDNFSIFLNSDVKVSELLFSADGPERIFDHISGGDGLGFLLISAFGLLFLTITARGRRLKLLQRIRKLREAIAEPINKNN
jgi:hypothetical protein